MAAVRRYVFDAIELAQVAELSDIGRRVEGEHAGLRFAGSAG
ncbi:hypothetical protein [Amycolatopsis solani]|nr:hypothetical protein [Amycolatopsis sp. MEP2-6]